MTNYEKIKAMSVEEMKDFLLRVSDSEVDGVKRIGEECVFEFCIDAWLKQEAEK